MHDKLKYIKYVKVNQTQISLRNLLRTICARKFEIDRNSHHRCSVKKIFLENSQNSQENTCARVSFLIKLQACHFIRKQTLAQVFSCEFCEFSKNTFFTEHLWWLLLDWKSFIEKDLGFYVSACILLFVLSWFTIFHLLFTLPSNYVPTALSCSFLTPPS